MVEGFHVTSLCSKGFMSPCPETKRGALVLPDTQTPKRSRATGTDEEFMKRHYETFREVASSSEQTAPFNNGEAIDSAMTHWPDHYDLYEMEPCNMFL